jgi:peptidyl-dipeptidase A
MNAIDQERAAERRRFLTELNARLQPLQIARSRAAWTLMTEGTDAAAHANAAASQALEEAYSDAEASATLNRWVREDATGDALVDREVAVLANAFARRQGDAETREQIVALESELSHTFSTFRGTLAGAPATSAAIDRVLASSTETSLRKQAWEAAMAIGPVVAPRVLELVRLRNARATALGYRDYFAMSLALAETDESELFSLLDTLEKATRAPFRTRKAVYDAERARVFGIEASALRPWHYVSPFFQRVEVPDAVRGDEVFGEQDLETLAARFFDSIGMNVRDVLERSDLHPREGKNQHAFCFNIDRAGDIRILANLESTERWAGTLLHECGHAVYDRYIDPKLPFALRKPAHTMVTEAIAMLMGRQTNHVDFLIECAGVPAMEVTPLSGELRRSAAFRMQVFVRWALVLIHFERDLYANPDRTDLNEHWWTLKRRYQLLEPPEDRDAPDWAAKLHLALAPVYYQNYVLGEVIASQLARYVADASRSPGLVDNLYAGEFLIQRVFALGARKRWDDLIEDATRKPLSADAFIAEYT